MQPVRIKYYGLFWITRRGYLLATLAAAVFAVAVFAVLLVALPERTGPYTWPPPFNAPWEPVPSVLPPGAFSLFYHYFWTLILLLLLAEILDIVVVLRKFAKKEAEQREASGGR
jgi:hypothetical protein